MDIIKLNEIKPSKSQVDIMANNMESLLESYSVEDLYTKLDFIGKVCSEGKDKIKDKLKSKLSGTTIEENGYKISLMETSIKYDYLGTNDPIYKKLMDEMESLKEKIKIREAFLKNIDSNMTILDEESGEVIVLTKPKKTFEYTPKLVLDK